MYLKKSGKTFNLRANKNNSNNSVSGGETSLGILNMDQLSVFGDKLSPFSTSDMKVLSTDERHRMEKIKAMQLLEKVKNLEKNKLLQTPKPIYNNPQLGNNIQTPGMDRTDYVPYRCYDTINVSELVSDKTIDIPSTSPIQTANKFSFEPSEMTARSTMCGNDRKRTHRTKSAMTVEEILASSCSENVRNLCESLRESYSGTSSLPRTADMSFASSTCDSLPMPNFRNNLSAFSKCHRADESAFATESFIPGEQMHMKLKEDEAEWEREYIAIPTASLKGGNCSKIDDFNSENNQNSFAQSKVNGAEPDLSMGLYFLKRSENLLEMIPEKSPTKRKAYALIDDDSIVSSTLSTASSKTSAAPIDDKTYEKLSSDSSRNNLMQTNSTIPTDEKGRPSTKYGSEILSISAIGRALDNINLTDGTVDVVDQLMNFGKKKEPLADITHQFYKASQTEEPEKRTQNLSKNNQQNVENIPDNKENYNSRSKRDILHSETVSFTESILDSSEYERHQDPKESQSPTSTTDTPVSRMISTKSKKDFGINTKTDANKLSAPVLKSRKRSHSSVRTLNENKLLESDAIYRRSKSPSNSKELAAVSHSQQWKKAEEYSKNAPIIVHKAHAQSSSPHSPLASDSSSMTSADRKLLVYSKSSIDTGNTSLPNYALATNSRAYSPTLGASKLRCNSQCSTTSEFNHQEGKLPLKSTTQEMTWGSVKLRTNSNKSFQIKNTANKRLVLKVEIFGPGFHIVNIETGSRLTLQAQECRTIILSFCPTVIGSAVGKLAFHPPIEHAPAYTTISLFGYGGQANLRPQGVSKGPVGTPFLTMGELKNLSHPFQKSFTLYNKGTLSAFGLILIDSLDVDHSRFCGSVTIEPNKVLVQPDSSVKINVTFKPRRNDIKKLLNKLSPVMSIANLKILSGDEPTRRRIRTLVREMHENEQSTLMTTSIGDLWTTFPDEESCGDYAMKFRERTTVAMELMSTLRTDDIVLTLENTDIDDTALESTLLYSDMDETVLFRTMVSNCSHVESSPGSQEKSKKKSMSPNTFDRELCSVRPSSLEIDPFDKTKKSTIIFSSHSRLPLSFEMDSNYKHLFTFNPKQGVLYPNEQIEITVCSFPTVFPSERICIMINIHNETIEIPVKIIKDSFPLHFR